jgi:hypothetical protein
LIQEYDSSLQLGRWRSRCESDQNRNQRLYFSSSALIGTYRAHILIWSFRSSACNC